MKANELLPHGSWVRRVKIVGIVGRCTLLCPKALRALRLGAGRGRKNGLDMRENEPYSPNMGPSASGLQACKAVLGGPKRPSITYGYLPRVLLSHNMENLYIFPTIDGLNKPNLCRPCSTRTVLATSKQQTSTTSTGVQRSLTCFRPRCGSVL